MGFETRHDDIMLPFQIENGEARGRLVRLGDVADTILNRHAYPPSESAVLGEALVLASLLGGALKMDGVFTLQTQSDGPLNLLVVDYDGAGRLRGYARSTNMEEAAEQDGTGTDSDTDTGEADVSFPRLVGNGHLAFTIDPGPGSERYQGVVELAGASLTDCAHEYFRTSEQLETAIKLTARQVDDGAGGLVWRAGGIMVQRLPEQAGFLDDEEREDAWRRAVTMMSSTRDEELVDSTMLPTQLLYRLFHEDGVRVFTPTDLHAVCRCSEQRIRNVLETFPADDITDMAVDGRIVVTCEFCRAEYVFTPEELLPPPS
jgi:molecular chaperone Hsp33